MKPKLPQRQKELSEIAVGVAMPTNESGSKKRKTQFKFKPIKEKPLQGFRFIPQRAPPDTEQLAGQELGNSVTTGLEGVPGPSGAHVGSFVPQSRRDKAGKNTVREQEPSKSLAAADKGVAVENAHTGPVEPLAADDADVTDDINLAAIEKNAMQDNTFVTFDNDSESDGALSEVENQVSITLTTTLYIT